MNKNELENKILEIAKEYYEVVLTKEQLEEVKQKIFCDERFEDVIDSNIEEVLED